MDAHDRASALVDILRRDGRILVADAAVRFGTAEMTIRRDLDQLVERGVARRVRGGAVSTLMRGDELPYSMRTIESTTTKKKLGQAVAELIGDGEAVALDSGTTTFEVARALSGRRMTIMPLSLHVASALASDADTRLILPGGEVRMGELTMTGPLALASISALRFDTAVLGCCGVTDSGDVTAYDLGDCAVKQAIGAAATRRILVLDGSKFGRSAMAVVGPVTTYDIVVTDSTAPPAMLARLKENGIVVHSV